MPKIRGIKPEFWTDEEIVELTPLARLLYIGLWNYACDNGHLEDRPKQIKMRVLPADDCSAADLLRELEEKGRITRRDGWITVPNLGGHQRIDKRFFTTCDQPDCAKPTTQEANPKRKTRRAPDVDTSSARVDHESTPGDGEGEVDGDGECDGDKSPGLTAPTPLVRQDVERICNLLADRIEGNGSKRPTITQKWRDAARLMIDNDGRTEQQVLAAIDWCQADEFWRSNILSVPKLREKYDALRLQATSRTAGVSTRQQNTDALFGRAAERLSQQGAAQ